MQGKDAVYITPGVKVTAVKLVIEKDAVIDTNNIVGIDLKIHGCFKEGK